MMTGGSKEEKSCARQCGVPNGEQLPGQIRVWSCDLVQHTSLQVRNEKTKLIIIKNYLRKQDMILNRLLKDQSQYLGQKIK
jgi:hypothetical protein